ncbi:sn-glycerol-1-phosphate dehydrogenase [Vallitalea guaymasensis]|uniref:sn-glycerol-1-phosphate dehydrogenase n=1 Tax=Vallitalea guaymasensis TaxID=1185412 RepID=A0A8J8MAI6_9FIRM|nr:sn-glycerol-1-phosphate dehydrogenase [Vallitalea guaymasensis]QUH29284.1 sn-glycerol-1-phosphate dehydrogenase [Vallitalea guaymasensis]
MDFKTFKIEDFLNKSFKCNCNKVHRTSIEEILIGENVTLELPKLINKYGYKNILIVSDSNTYKVLGETVEKILKDSQISCTSYVFEETNQLVPDEQAVGRLLTNIDDNIDLMITVGSGTLNDLSKFVSYKIHIPYFIVATAPSMDGYASTVSPLIVNNLKTTYEVNSPKAIIADINIIKKAPMEMITAGLGDILGKYTCLCDWKISSIINDEYYCESVVDLVKESIHRCVKDIEGIKNRDTIAIKNLTEGLILSGIAMSFVGNSRPASGAEHHLSHYWEMMFLFQGKEAVLHGTKVGIATLIIAKLYEMLTNTNLDFEKALKHAEEFDYNDWVKNIKQKYKHAANDVIKLEQKTNKNSKEEHKIRIQKINQNWDEIIDTIKDIIPPTEELKAILLKVGATITPNQVEVDSTTVSDSIKIAKELRARYTVLQLLWDVGLLDEFASI